MKRIFTTTLRLNLADEDDRRAFEYLRRMDKKKYRSYSKAIVAAVNDHFERQERLAADPYLETREKEDTFLRKVTEAIETGLQTVSFYAPIISNAPQGESPSPAGETPDEEDITAALDFADSF